MRLRLFPLLVITAIEALPAEDPVMAILSRCSACHAGANAAAGLVLTDREAALKGGKSGPALAPGSAAGSLVYQMASSK